MDEQTSSVPCGCGCGFLLAPGMYGRMVRGAWYAQGCVGSVRPIEVTSADISGAPPYPR